jgi:polyadenylate-binding protein
MNTENQKQNINQFVNPMTSMMPGAINVNSFSPEATLYIGNLQHHVQDMELYNYFRPYGNIVSCRVMKDIYSGESRGFAFISYSSKEEAQKAKDALNYHKINGWEIRISFKKSPGDFDPKANIFIKNLDKEVSTRQIDELCQQFGTLMCCCVRTDDNGQSLGYAYVQYQDEESAKRAVEALNGIKKWGNELQSEIFVPSKQRTMTKKNLYLKNFPKSWDKVKVETFITEEFGAIGKVTCSGVYENKADEENVRHYAFVAYEEEEQASVAIEKYHEHKLEGHAEDEEETFYVVYVVPKRIRKEQLKKQHLSLKNLTNLYIKSLNIETTSDILTAVFEKYGPITSVCVKESKPFNQENPVVMKFGFINFKEEADAQKAFLNGKKDESILALLHESAAGKDFLFFAQPKSIRNQYNKMKRSMYNNFIKPVPMMFNNQRGAGPGGFNNMMAPHNMGLNMSIGNMPYMDPNSISMIQAPMMPNMGNTFNISNTPSNHMSTPSSLSRPNERKEPTYDTNWLKNNKTVFMDFEDEKRRNVLGELMFSKIQKTNAVNSENISKVTGMLIDLDILDYEEIIDMLENEDSLKERIVEALEVINDSD